MSNWATDWFQGFNPLTTEGDGRGDYHDQLQTDMAGRDRELRTNRLSSTWARGRSKSTQPDRVVMDLIQIKSTVHSLLKVHGLLPNTQVAIPCLGKIGAGAASFLDVGKWKKPVLLLDADIYKNCESTEVLDTYCGVGLHEASHLNHTRTMFERMQAGTLTGERKMWEGLFEDERIENKVREESPGFGGYLDALKRALFDKKEFGCSIDRWEEKTTYKTMGTIDKPGLSDMDRINILIFAFIRAPYKLTDSMKAWETLTGRCVFDELRGMFPRVPEIEAEVEDYGQKLVDWYQSIKDDYEDLKSETAAQIAQQLRPDEGETGQGESGGGDSSPDQEASPEGQQGPQGNPPQDEEGETADTKSSDEGGAEPAQNDQDGQPAAQADPSPQAEAGPPEGEGQGGADSDDDGTQAEGGQKLQSDGQAGRSGPTEADVQERLDIQQEQVTQDRNETDSKAELEKLADEYKSSLKEYEDAKSTGEAQESERTQKRVEKFEAKKNRIEKALAKKVAERMELGRFGMKDMIEMMRRMETVTEPLNKEESEAMAEADALRVEQGPKWQPERDSVAQNCLIVHPVVGPKQIEKYKSYHESVRGDIARMKQVFRFRLGTHKTKIAELREGRLDRRRLGRAMEKDARLFYKTRTKTDKGIAIGLLLDESGSMGDASQKCRDGDYSSKATKALQVGILMTEALMAVQGVELEVYSFTTGGDQGDDTYFKYLYGKNNPHKEAIANYESGRANYDYQAIMTATEQMKKWTTEDKKMLIVVSDGAPCGHMMSGMGAREATKASVDAARKQGFTVLQIAIQDFRGSEEMYGAKNVIKFTDMAELIANMRRFITRIVRDVS